MHCNTDPSVISIVNNVKNPQKQRTATTQQQTLSQTKDSRGTRGDTRCTCPDPAQPLPNSDSTWRKHHLEMVKDARQAPRDLDIVFLGDSMIERWNGTRNMGQQSIPGMRKVFAERFTVKGGGTFEGLALGSSGDTVSLFLRKNDGFDMDIKYPIFHYSSSLTPQTCYC